MLPLKYIVFDLEFNSPFKIDKITKQLMRGKANPLCPQEIIEIGAVKVNEKLDIEDTYQQYIKPRLYTKLHPKVRSKTRISYEDLEGGKGIIEAISSFREWIADSEYILCSWGSDDINELKRNCKFFNIDTSWIDRFIDIQKAGMKSLRLPMGQQLGLKNALVLLNIEIDTKLHKALNDSVFTAKIFKAIAADNISEGVGYQLRTFETIIDTGSEEADEDY